MQGTLVELYNKKKKKRVQNCKQKVVVKESAHLCHQVFVISFLFFFFPPKLYFSLELCWLPNHIKGGVYPFFHIYLLYIYCRKSKLFIYQQRTLWQRTLCCKRVTTPFFLIHSCIWVQLWRVHERILLKFGTV